MNVELDAQGYPVVFTFPTEVGDIHQGGFTNGRGACCSLGWIYMNFYGTPRVAAEVRSSKAEEHVCRVVAAELVKENESEIIMKGLAMLPLNSFVDWINDGVLTKAQIVKAWSRVAKRLGYVERCEIA